VAVERQDAGLARWGRLVHRARWHVLILSALSLVPAAWMIHTGGELDPPHVRTETESGRGLELIGRELPGQPPSFSLIFSSPTLSATAPAFRAEVERALAPLGRDPRVARIRTAYDGLPGAVLGTGGARWRWWSCGGARRRDSPPSDSLDSLLACTLRCVRW
jgi:hypothetical protein